MPEVRMLNEKSRTITIIKNNLAGLNDRKGGTL
jgi:hypothetical protein